MSRLKASLLVSLKDDTGSGARGVKQSLNDIERAERNLALARRGARLTRVEQEEDALQLARDRQAMRLEHERQAQIERRHRLTSMMLNGAAIGTVALGYAAAKSYSKFAGVERQIGRIALNADKGAQVVGPTLAKLQGIARDTAMSFEDVSSGLETLVASGRSLEDSMAFLPSVAMTAQASGAAISDIALSADALAGSMKISGADMQKAFDILVAGGKAGKFELKDMAQYLPSLLPAFAALGYEGTEGMQKIVAMLQVVRNQAGSSAEAATYLGNVFQKMYSEETAKKFKKFGVDLPKALDKAKREGRDVLDVFLDMTAMATKGDLSKLTQLFTDAEMQKGIRALMMGRGQLEQFTRSLGNVEGSALKDFNQIAEDSAAKIQRLSTLWDQFVTQIGGEVADVANPVLEKVTTAISDVQARSKAREEQGEMRANNRREFDRRMIALDPEKYDIKKNRLAQALLDDAFHDAETRLGRGEYKTLYDGVDAQLSARNRKDQYRHGYQPGKGQTSLGVPETRYPDALDPSGARVNGNGRPSKNGERRLTENVPLPGQRPTAESRQSERLQEALGQYGVGRSFVNDEAVRKAQDWSRKTWQDLSHAERRKRLRAASLEQVGMDGMFGAELEKAAGVAKGGVQPVEIVNPDALKGDGQGIMKGLEKSEPLDFPPKEVTILGTVTTQPSGVQTVRVANPTPIVAPINIGVTVNVASSADPQKIGDQVARQIRDRVKDAYAGLQADISWGNG